MGLMAEMNASFQKLAHREVRKRHEDSPVVPPRTRELHPFLAVGGKPPDGCKAKVRV